MLGVVFLHLVHMTDGGPTSRWFGKRPPRTLMNVALGALGYQ
jgi:hypothetical protein